MEMGKEIRRLRNDRGLTQETLAAALNVSPQTVSKWECGNSVPDVQMLPEIAVYFGVTIDQLFAMTPEQHRKGQEIQPSPKFTDSAASIAHICEIRGDRAGAVEAYREVMRLQQNEWGITSGELREEVERAIQRLS